MSSYISDNLPSKEAMFHNNPITVFEINGEPYVPGEDLGKCLGFADARRAVNNIYNRNREELQQHKSTIKLRTPSFVADNRGGSMQNVDVYSETGCYLISTFSRSKKAKEVRLWLATLPRKIGSLAAEATKDKQDTLAHEEAPPRHSFEQDTQNCKSADIPQTTLVHILDTDLPILFYKDQPVVTLSQIDKVHKRPAETSHRNFNRNRKHFLEGEDFYKLPYKEWNKIFAGFIASGEKSLNNQQVNLSRQRNPMIFLTESGYLMLTKPMKDDLSWQVQRMMVKNYFTMKQGQSQPHHPFIYSRAGTSPSDQIIHKDAVPGDGSQAGTSPSGQIIHKDAVPGDGSQPMPPQHFTMSTKKATAADDVATDALNSIMSIDRLSRPVAEVLQCAYVEGYERGFKEGYKKGCEDGKKESAVGQDALQKAEAEGIEKGMANILYICKEFNKDAKWVYNFLRYKRMGLNYREIIKLLECSVDTYYNIQRTLINGKPTQGKPTQLSLIKIEKKAGGM